MYNAKNHQDCARCCSAVGYAGSEDVAMGEPIKPQRSAEETRRLEERKRSSAAGTHDTRSNRRRTRGDDERAALREEQD